MKNIREAILSNLHHSIQNGEPIKLSQYHPKSPAEPGDVEADAIIKDIFNRDKAKKDQIYSGNS